jgi:hypothetical protein
MRGSDSPPRSQQSSRRDSAATLSRLTDIRTFTDQAMKATRSWYRNSRRSLLRCATTVARNLRCGAVSRIRSASISYRAEFVDDYQGQRTGTKTRYIETGIGRQHWFSPRIEVRPEVSYYKSLDAFAFNGNPNLGIPANRNYAIIGSADIIIHF